MGAEPTMETTSTRKMTVKTTTVKTTTASEGKGDGNGTSPTTVASPSSSFGDYFMRVFRGGASAKEKPVEEEANEVVKDEKAEVGLYAKKGTRLRKAQDEYDLAETRMAAAQTTFEAVAKEYGTAKERLEMAQKSGLPGAAQVAEAALAQTKAKLERASAGFQKAEKELQKASKTKREQEVALAESAKTRDIRERLFDSAGKTGDFDADADEEAKRLAAVITLQRAWRRYKARKRNRNPENIAKRVVRGLLSRHSAFAMLVWFLLFSGSLFGHSTSVRESGVREAIRTFSALDHGYLKYGVSSGTVMAELTVLRAKHDKVLTEVEECETSLRASRSGTGSSQRAIEKELALMKKTCQVDDAIAANSELKVLRAELALTRHKLDVQRKEHEQNVEYLMGVHEAENERLMAHAQANVMDARHEGAQRLRESQLENEELRNDLDLLQHRIDIYENERKGEPLTTAALVNEHDAVMKTLRKKHKAEVHKLEFDYRSKLSDSKAENAKLKDRDLKSLHKVKEKHLATQKSLEDMVKLSESHASAAKAAVCSSKRWGLLSWLVYPLIALVALLLGTIANENHHAMSTGAPKPVSAPKAETPVKAEPAVGVPVCKRDEEAERQTETLRRRCEDAEKQCKDLRDRCEFAEDSTAALRKEIKSLQEDNIRVSKRLSERVVIRNTKLDGVEARELAEMEQQLEEENIRLTTRVHEAQARALELTEQKEMLTIRVDTIQKKLIEEGATIKELSDRLILTEKENFELRQIIEETRAECRTAENKLEELSSTLDSSGKQRGNLEEELEAANKRLKDAAAQLTKSAVDGKHKASKIEALTLSKDEVEKQLAAVSEDLLTFRERAAVSERTRIQVETENAELQARTRRLKSTHETQVMQLQKRLKEVEEERTNLAGEQERLLEEVVSKQEEIDNMMQEVVQLQDSDDNLGRELTDLVQINESMRERLEDQDAELKSLGEKLGEKELIIVEHESYMETLNSRFQKTQAKLKACESSRDEGITLLRNRDTRIQFLEEELTSVREMQSTNSARLSEQLKRLGELEMDSGRKHAAKEAAELQLEQYEEQAKKTIARLEHELAELQNQLAAEKANNETLRTADGVNASKLRQEARQLQEKIAELNACETEKGQMVEEIARLEKELEELRKRLAELLQELGELKSNRQTRAPPSPPVEEAEMVEERQQLVYDEAASMLEGLRRVSLFNLLYSVSFSKVRDQRQWKALTLSALYEAVRPLPVNRKRDSMYYAKKRSARVLIHLASTPHHHKLSRSGWLESEQGAMEFVVGWHEAEDVWIWATRALAAISRIFQGPNAHQLYQLGGLQAALELMRHAESDKEIQLHGSRAISGLVSGDLAFFGQEAPQIVSGSALETLAVTLRTFPLDARIVRAASRAVWVCVHLGRQFGQHTFVQQGVYEPLMFAMNCHLSDIKIVESCCGAVLAAAARNPDTQDKLAEAGVRDIVRDTLQSIEQINFTGAFSDLSDWLFES
tara:strand:+ start:17150 stop:21619 length:4470 start_codon:yes stop_codon:yes gene_type:complete